MEDVKSVEQVKSVDQLEQLKETEEGLLVLFGGANCNVCHSIKPKLMALMDAHYPNIKMVYVDCHVDRDICSQNSVFTLPTLQVFFTGQKFIEEVRSFSLQKVMQDLERPYSMVFSA